MDKELKKEEMEGKVRDWFESSGKMKEIQAKLRSELFEIIQSQLKTKQDLPLKVTPKTKTSPPLTKVVNWLISEHLAQNQNWLTNSVFVTEAEIEEKISVPGVVISSQLGARCKQYETEVVSGETVSHVLRLLGFERNQGLLQTVLQNHHKKSQSVLCSLISGIASDDSKSAMGGKDRATEPLGIKRRTQEKSIPGHLQSIDAKYDNILQDFKNQRNQERKQESEKCLSCINKGQETGFKQRAEERNKARYKVKIVEPDSSVSDVLSDHSIKVEMRAPKNRKTEDRNKDYIVESEDKKYKMLYEKIDQFLLVQEKDKGLVTDLTTSLKTSESEIMFLRHQLQKKDDKAKEEEEEHLVNLSNIVEKQNEKIEGQNNEILKLKNMIEISKLREKANTLKSSNQNRTDTCNPTNIGNNVKTLSPTVDFFDQMKNKLDGMVKENTSIENEFEDLQSDPNTKE